MDALNNSVNDPTLDGLVSTYAQSARLPTSTHLNSGCAQSFVVLRNISALSLQLKDYRSRKMKETASAVLIESEQHKEGVLETISKYGEKVLTPELKEEVTYETLKKGLDNWFLSPLRLVSATNQKNIQDRILDCYKNKSKSLDLSACALDSIPTGVESLTHLEKLDLHSNKLISLPPNLSNLKELKELDCSNNEIKDLPGTFKSLSNLRTLNMRNTSISHIPALILELPKLTHLNLQATSLLQVSTETIPEAFFQKGFKELKIDDSLAGLWKQYHQRALDCIKS